MLHVPISHASRPARTASAAAPLTPAAYLRLRRHAAGLSVEDVARVIAPRERDRAEAAALVRTLETDGCRARHTRTLRELRRAFRFDANVYRQLCEEPANRHPRICRDCGCSHYDPCEDFEHGGACGWAEPERCTSCERGEIAA